MGITEGGGGPWRISHANEDFKLSPTYPSLLVVPSEMTDQGTSTAPFDFTIQCVSGTLTPHVSLFGSSAMQSSTNAPSTGSSAVCPLSAGDRGAP
jgi:hypothetical protein